MIEKWFPNGVNTQYSYNRDNTLKQVINRHGVGITISQHDYTYDGVGNRITHSELINGTTNPYTYAYDALNRLTTVTNTSTSAVESYAYDPLGNRNTKTAAGSTLAYVYDSANQLTEIRQTSIAGTLLGGLVYDNNGNLTKKCESGTVTVSSSNCSGTTVTDLTHDGFNRLTQVAKTGILTESYKYDDQGNRIQKSVGGTIANFLYNGPDVIGQYTSSWGTASAILTHGPGMDDPIIRATSSTTQYFHQDGLGSVVSVTNQSGTTDGTARFDAWGNKIASTGTIPQYGYTGREPDDTGLIYYRARFYDPSIGRFTQRDPFGLRGGLNSFAYVKNNPTNLIDPNGEFASIWPFWHGIITYDVARLRGHGVLESIEYAWAASKPDFNPLETLSPSQEAQVPHALTGKPPAGQLLRTPKETLRQTQKFIDARLGSPSISSQGEGIHATQDVAQHEGAIFGEQNTILHLLGDMFPSAEKVGLAYERTFEAFDSIGKNLNSRLQLDVVQVCIGGHCQNFDGPSQSNMRDMTSPVSVEQRTANSGPGLYSIDLK